MKMEWNNHDVFDSIGFQALPLFLSFIFLAYTYTWIAQAIAWEKAAVVQVYFMHELKEYLERFTSTVYVYDVMATGIRPPAPVHASSLYGHHPQNSLYVGVSN